MRWFNQLSHFVSSQNILLILWCIFFLTKILLHLFIIQLFWKPFVCVWMCVSWSFILKFHLSFHQGFKHIKLIKGHIPTHFRGFKSNNYTLYVFTSFAYIPPKYTLTYPWFQLSIIHTNISIIAKSSQICVLSRGARPYSLRVLQSIEIKWNWTRFENLSLENGN